MPICQYPDTMTVQPAHQPPAPGVTRITILGSGTSHGVPAIGCDCSVCTSDNPRNRRRRSFLYAERGETGVIVDTPPDFREAVLAFGIRRLNGVLFTHEHADHIFGCDDLRPFNYFSGNQTIPAYGHPRTIERLKVVFDYFERPVQIGGGVPNVQFIPTEETVRIGDIEAEPLLLFHGKLPVYGYRIGNIAYCNDTNNIPGETMEKLQGLDVLFLDALRHEPHSTHFTIEQAVDIAQQLAPRQTYFVHMAHDLDHSETNRMLPEGMELAYDGLVVES